MRCTRDGTRAQAKGVLTVYSPTAPRHALFDTRASMRPRVYEYYIRRLRVRAPLVRGCAKSPRLLRFARVRHLTPIVIGVSMRASQQRGIVVATAVLEAAAEKALRHEHEQREEQHPS